MNEVVIEQIKDVIYGRTNKITISMVEQRVAFNKPMSPKNVINRKILYAHNLMRRETYKEHVSDLVINICTIMHEEIDRFSTSDDNGVITVNDVLSHLKFAISNGKLINPGCFSQVEGEILYDAITRLHQKITDINKAKLEAEKQKEAEKQLKAYETVFGVKNANF